MKVGDVVYVVSDQTRASAGARAEIVVLDGSTAWVAVNSVESRQVLPMQTWDLLPAKAYGCAVLHAVHATLQSLEAKRGSILIIKPQQLVRKLVEHGLNSPAATSLSAGDLSCCSVSALGTPARPALFSKRRDALHDGAVSPSQPLPVH